jgi:site-specific DNA-methyltransferase (adenine-specific)
MNSVMSILSETYNEDCMALMSRYRDNYFELAIVDPPYGIERFKKPSGNTRFGSSKLMQESGLTWDKKPSKEYFNELFRVSRNQIIWGANNFELPPTEYFCIWNKQQSVDNFASAEYAWVSMGLRQPALVFDYSIHKHNQTDKIHPTQKPIALYDWIFNKYAKESDFILDTHLGSQSSRIAAYKAGLDFVGSELDTDYFNQGNQRFEEFKIQFEQEIGTEKVLKQQHRLF